MTVALILVASLVGAFYFREAKRTLDAEIRDRALYVAREIAALTADDITTGNLLEIYRKIAPPFAADDESHSGNSLRYLMVYNHACKMLIASTAAEVYLSSGASFYTRPGSNLQDREDTTLHCDSDGGITEPVFRIKADGVYDLTLPVMSGADRVGYVRAGISSQRFEQKFSGFITKSAVALIGILLVGLAFSQIIAISITRPILQLSKAADRLSQQDWDTPFPVKGSDEISKLGHTFNQMALTLRTRDTSLSRGNRDLFLLHTAGLDLMESLDQEALLVKIAARAEDLVRADTIAISVVDRSDRMLKYLGVYGSRSHVIRGLEMPVEAGGIYNWLVSYGTPLLIPDALADFRLDSTSMKSLGFRSIMTIPLWSANTMTGLITAVNKKGGTNFDKHDLRLFTVFSSLAAAALQNASLYSDLKGKMSELHATQEQLLHSTRMVAIGELSANVAHEINNPLTSVLGYTTHLIKTLDLPDEPKRILGLMEQETLRVRKIIRNLLDFARQRPSWMQPGDLTQPLRETVALLQGIAEQASVRIQEDYPESPVIVNMDHNEMKQVFINILNNALQAMPHGGVIAINVDIASEQECFVVIRDSGVGIAAEHKNKIFEPFFSTKEKGDGTGLGLSISYRIVQNHGGSIEVQSEQGQGTTFRVVLPLYKLAAV